MLGIITSLLQTWEWIPPSLGDLRFSLEQGGGFLALQGWICEQNVIDLTSANITSLPLTNDPLLDNYAQDEVDDPGSLPPTSDDLIPHIYDFNVVS